jgi:hypothetical protein
MACNVCGREDEKNPSDHYHKKACEARHISKLIANGEDTPENKRLLELARYVGD